MFGLLLGACITGLIGWGVTGLGGDTPTTEPERANDVAGRDQAQGNTAAPWGSFSDSAIDRANEISDVDRDPATGVLGCVSADEVEEREDRGMVPMDMSVASTYGMKEEGGGGRM